MVLEMSVNCMMTLSMLDRLILFSVHLVHFKERQEQSDRLLLTHTTNTLKLNQDFLGNIFFLVTFYPTRFSSESRKWEGKTISCFPSLCLV